jgi:hypothetical protein
MWLEALAGCLSGFLGAYFDKHSFSKKKIFLLSFSAFAILFWLGCIISVPGKSTLMIMLYSSAFGLFGGTLILTSYLLGKEGKEYEKQKLKMAN